MRHGYTNRTEHRGSEVTKTYDGPRAMERARTERAALVGLAGRVPVPTVLGGDAGSVVTAFVPGRHGQELIDAGQAHDVLAGCGAALRRLHVLDPGVVFPASAEGVIDGVIVHGDFGPNNVLFSPAGFAPVAVLDWEFCHVGSRIEDLAWCEWIVRTHHPQAVDAVADLFTAYGWTPSWTDRQQVMLDRCRSLEQFCREWEPDGAGVATWVDRGRRTAGWRE